MHVKPYNDTGYSRGLSWPFVGFLVVILFAVVVMTRLNKQAGKAVPVFFLVVVLYTSVRIDPFNFYFQQSDYRR